MRNFIAECSRRASRLFKWQEVVGPDSTTSANKPFKEKRYECFNAITKT